MNEIENIKLRAYYLYESDLKSGRSVQSPEHYWWQSCSIESKITKIGRLEEVYNNRQLSVSRQILLAMIILIPIFIIVYYLQ